MFLDEVRVPGNCLIGRPSDGLAGFRRIIYLGRLKASAAALGLSKEALREAAAHASKPSVSEEITFAALASKAKFSMHRDVLERASARASSAATRCASPALERAVELHAQVRLRLEEWIAASRGPRPGERDDQVRQATVADLAMRLLEFEAAIDRASRAREGSVSPSASGLLEVALAQVASSIEVSRRELCAWLPDAAEPLLPKPTRGELDAEERLARQVQRGVVGSGAYASGAIAERASYRELVARSVGIAAALRAELAPDDRALVIGESPSTMVSGILACLFASAVPVPAPSPEGGLAARGLERLDAIASDCLPSARGRSPRAGARRST